MRKLLYTIAIMGILLHAHYVYSAEKPPESASARKMPDLKSQFFCGYCHILTYPKVVKKAHKSWQDGKHKEVPCSECHYPPGQIDITIPAHENIPRDEETASGKRTDMEFMKTELEVLSRLVTILNMEESVVRTRPRIDDGSCTTKCHLTTGIGKEGEFWTKKINYVESEREDKTKRIIPYVHKTHFDRTKLVEGQEMHCTTCHQRETGKKHFEVSSKKCFLCHFKNARLNEERAKCSLCHEIPTKPLQRQKKEGGDDSEKPITHQSLEEAKVKCDSCHLHMIRGSGTIKQEKCLACHDNEEPITKEGVNKKLMHEKHVADQNAGCFNCHEPIEHDQGGDSIDFARTQCQACHPDHHKYQKLLLLGEKRPGVSNMPGLMYMVNTNCLACHQDERMLNGEKVAHGTGKTCAACHTEKHEGMAKEWKEKTEEVIKNASKIKKEAMEVIEAAKGNVPQETIDEAMEMVKQGEENLNIVEFGGGVHNQKYSVMLLDAAMVGFEDAVYLIEDEEEGEEEMELDCECDDGKLICADEDAEEEAELYACECDEEGDVVCEEEAEEEEEGDDEEGNEEEEDEEDEEEDGEEDDQEEENES